MIKNAPIKILFWTLFTAGAGYWINNQMVLRFGQGSNPDPTTTAQATTPEIHVAPVSTEPSFPGAGESDRARELQVLFATGAYRKAVELADRLLADNSISEPLRAWLEMQLPILLGSAGWAAIATNNCDDAITLLRRAANYFDRSDTNGAQNVPPQTRADILRGLGYCLKRSGNAGGAEENFHQALEANPDDRESRLLLVDVLETDGRFVEGLELLESAPSPDENIKDRLKILKRRAGEGELQQTLKSPHFNISYRAGAHAELATKVAEILESSLYEFMDGYGYREPRVPIDVLLYPRASFSWVLGDAPGWAEGIFDGRMRIPVSLTSDSNLAQPQTDRRSLDSMKALTSVLRHELIHALNASMTGGRALPPWLEEGLAQRIGEMKRGAVFPFPIKPPPFMAADRFAHSYLQYAATEANTVYKQSLYLVLTLEYQEPDSLKKIISNLSPAGATGGDAALQVLDIGFAKLFHRASTLWRERQPLAAK